MKKNIYCMGAYREDTSLGIYSRALMEYINISREAKVIDIRRIYQQGSFIKHITQYIKYIFSFFCKQNFKAEDVILELHNINMIPPLMLGIPSKKIHIVHDFFYYDKDFYYNKKGIEKLMYYYYNTIHKFLYKIVFKRANRIVAISQATKNEIINKFGTSFEKKIDIIYNGMDTTAFQPLSGKKIERKDPYLLYVGSELERKNLKNIIAAFALVKKKFPNIKLIKAPIENTPEYREQTLKYIKNNDLIIGKDIILINEYLSLNKLVELYQNAEIFLFPTLKEGFGFPIIEAQACGIPVITTNYEPMIELVPYKNMTVDPQNPKDIGEKIIQVIENPDLKGKMIKDGLEYVKNFSWEITGKKFIELINKV